MSGSKTSLPTQSFRARPRRRSAAPARHPEDAIAWRVLHHALGVRRGPCPGVGGGCAERRTGPRARGARLCGHRPSHRPENGHLMAPRHPVRVEPICPGRGCDTSDGTRRGSRSGVQAVASLCSRGRGPVLGHTLGARPTRKRRKPLPRRLLPRDVEDGFVRGERRQRRVSGGSRTRAAPLRPYRRCAPRPWERGAGAVGVLGRTQRWRPPRLRAKSFQVASGCAAK